MASNLVSNGDFENGTANWSFTNQGSGVADESETITNKYCKISTTESIYQQLAVGSGDKVTVSLSSRGVLSGTISVMLNNSNTSYWSDTFNSEMNSTWTSENFSFTVGSDWTGPLVLHFQAAYSATATDVVEVDNIIASK